MNESKISSIFIHDKLEILGRNTDIISVLFRKKKNQLNLELSDVTILLLVLIIDTFVPIIYFPGNLSIFIL